MECMVKGEAERDREQTQKDVNVGQERREREVGKCEKGEFQEKNTLTELNRKIHNRKWRNMVVGKRKRVNLDVM